MTSLTGVEWTWPTKCCIHVHLCLTTSTVPGGPGSPISTWSFFLNGVCWVRSCSRVTLIRLEPLRGLGLHMYADDMQLYTAFKPVGGGESWV